MLSSGVIFMVEGQDLLKQALEESKKELELARELFSQVLDEDLIDEAVYRLQAAESRYSYLLKQAKKEFSITSFEVKE